LANRTPLGDRASLYKIQIYIFAHLNRSEFALFAKAAGLKGSKFEGLLCHGEKFERRAQAAEELFGSFLAAKSVPQIFSGV